MDKDMESIVKAVESLAGALPRSILLEVTSAEVVDLFRKRAESHRWEARRVEEALAGAGRGERKDLLALVGGLHDRMPPPFAPKFTKSPEDVAAALLRSHRRQEQWWEFAAAHVPKGRAFSIGLHEARGFFGSERLADEFVAGDLVGLPIYGGEIGGEIAP